MRDGVKEGVREGSRRWIGRAALGLGIFAVFMFVSSMLVLSHWSEVRRATPQEAAREFAERLAQAGGGTAYLQVAEDGSVRVQRDQEGDAPASLRALHVLAWEPDGGRLVHVDFPFWFVRMKLSDSLNLGTFTTFLAGDWGNLDLSVTEEDLELRGPGLVLDQTRADGARILLWTEGDPVPEREPPPPLVE